MFDQFAPNSHLFCCVPFMWLSELQSLFCKPSALQSVVRIGRQEIKKQVKKGKTNYFNVTENVISVDTFFQQCLSIGKREYSTIEVKKSNYQQMRPQIAKIHQSIFVGSFQSLHLNSQTIFQTKNLQPHVCSARVNRVELTKSDPTNFQCQLPCLLFLLVKLNYKTLDKRVVATPPPKFFGKLTQSTNEIKRHQNLRQNEFILEVE